MKILRLLSKVFLTKIFIILSIQSIFANEPEDIWNINNNSNNINGQKEKNLSDAKDPTSVITGIKNSSQNTIELEDNIKIDSREYLVGLFDPAENDLTLNMWELSDGEKINKIIYLRSIPGFISNNSLGSSISARSHRVSIVSLALIS